VGGGGSGRGGGERLSRGTSLGRKKRGGGDRSPGAHLLCERESKEIHGGACMGTISAAESRLSLQ